MPYVNEPVYVDDVFEADVFTGASTDLIQEIRLDEKIIYLKLGVREYHPTDDIYPEVRFHRQYDESLRLIDMPVDASGNVFKGGSNYTARLATFKDGWKVTPAPESHVLKITGEQISDDGQSGAAIMDMTKLPPGVNVSIEYTPPSTELIVVDNGGGTIMNTGIMLEVAPGVFINA